MKSFYQLIDNHNLDIIDCQSYQVYHMYNKSKHITYNTKNKVLYFRYNTNNKIITDEKLIKVFNDTIKKELR